MDIILIYTTVETTEQAEHVARILISEQLIACANMWPIQSMYMFKNKFVKSNEIGMYLKTYTEKHDEVYKRLSELHPYECPAIMTLKIDRAHPSFLDWMKEQTHATT